VFCFVVFDRGESMKKSFEFSGFVGLSHGCFFLLDGVEILSDFTFENRRVKILWSGCRHKAPFFCWDITSVDVKQL
jgi:hypothetical protein